ncbi:MAG: hypothetical protein RL383_1211 [Actinomycetota bacterium]
MNRSKLISSVSVSLMLGGLFTAGVSTQSVQAAPSATTQPKKVTICHRTHATTNPYVRITVSESSISNAANKHGGSKHDQYPSGSSKPVPNVFDPTKTYVPNQKKWGDIIPNVYTDGTPFTAAGSSTNFTGLGLAIWNNTGAGVGLCVAKSARDLYELEKASGEVTEREIQDDLDESGADEFASALSACGGTTFVGCSSSNLGPASATTTTTTTTAPAGSATTVAGGATTGGATTTTVAGAKSTLAAGKGGLTVLVWIDGNRDGKQGADEPVYPGVTCTATGPGGATKTAVSDASGSASFVDLDPGAWSVKCDLTDESLEKVYDSDTTVDWTAAVTVEAGKFAEAKFGAAGTSSIEVSGVSTDSVSIKWAGADGELNTDDDVVFQVKGNGGKVSVQGLPAGKYVVSVTGNFDSEDEAVTLSLGAGEDATAVMPTLSKTGLSREPLMSLVAALMLLSGAALLLVRRRPV